MGDKRRQVEDKCEIMRVGDKWETSVKSCGLGHSEHPECMYWETSEVETSGTEITRAENPNAKSCGRKHSWRQLGDVQRQVGDKCEIMQTRAL